MDQIKIGGFLKDLRKEKGITQEQLAEKLGVSGRTISRWELLSHHADGYAVRIHDGESGFMVSYHSNWDQRRKEK